MPQRSDARRRMVRAARQLIRQRGYNATAISDVLERSGAPRGSVYFHGQPRQRCDAEERGSQGELAGPAATGAAEH